MRGVADFPYPNEHSARLLDPGTPHDGVASKELAPGVRAILFIKDNKSEVQAIRFDRTKFTPEEAKAWLDKGGFKPISFEPAVGKAEQAGNAVHDVVLQRLDQETEYGKYTPEAFEPTAHLWDGIPLVYAQQHPDPKAMLDDPIAELARIDGRIVGAVKGGAIATEGTPRLMGAFDWADDEEVQKAYEEGKLGHSTSFFYGGKGKDGAVKEPIIPNHVLLFKMDGSIEPKDKGAMILNAEQIKTGEGGTLMDRFKAWLASAPKLDGQDGGKEVDQKEHEQALASVNAELTDTKTKLGSAVAEAAKNAEEIKRLGGELEKANVELKKQAEIAANAKYEQALKDLHVPVGKLAGENAKKDREKYDADPTGWAIEHAKNAIAAPKDTEEQGAEHAGNAGKAKRTVTAWNARKGELEEIEVK
jgi:hypothetical protein